MDNVREQVIQKARSTILARSMINKGDRVIAGLSGGADSVCLLRVLQLLENELGFTLEAVHVDHRLRGEESDRDRDFCDKLCHELGIPIKICRVNVSEYSEKNGLSTEEAARILRYKAFETAFDGSIPRKTATAHNMGDNAETVLFNIARGTGMKGVGGIPYVRDNIIRPLLDVTRAEIEGFLTAEGLAYVTDSTNLTDNYSRNRIRHRVIPELESVNSGFVRNVSRLSQSAEEDEDYFDSLLSGIDPCKLPRYHPAVRKRFIRRLLREKGAECSYERLCAIDKMVVSGKGRLCLQGSLFAAVKDGKLEVEEINCTAMPDFSRKINFFTDRVMNLENFDKTVIISGVNDDFFHNNEIVNRNLTYDVVNCGKIQGDVVLRNKHDGDKIVLAGRDFSTKLKKLYNSLKLPEESRRTALVMEDEGGLIWSEYGGVSQRVKACAGDSREDIFKITVRRFENDGK